MADTGAVATVDLNADLAEGDVLSAGDLAVLDVVTSANLACGFHAGGPAVMRAATEACVERGVSIGAHVSYRDRAGFGRRRLDVALDRLAADVAEQWDALEAAAAPAGAAVAYAKAHGALYHAMAADTEVAEAVIGALGAGCRAVVLPPTAGPARDLAARSGRRTVIEGFPDRAYRPDGSLADRSQPGALITSDADAAARACSMALASGVPALDGTWVPLAVGTLCIHGDHPGAPERAREVRRSLEAAGVAVTAFAPPAGGVPDR
jgi:UPF0271 protein